jgi:ribosomal-protein-alanine N-acetyltransferase
LTTAFAIETRAHAFPWSEKTFASNQGERYLNFNWTLTADGGLCHYANCP